ncbi:outer membrane beta-barrel protein [Agarivorans sp. QJM3NY_29]|uniref:outer membrane beta-barrel protein n=1 Tax=unclassified Agarivorans TaxID=2636026 RepID=UPI003D7D7743
MKKRFVYGCILAIIAWMGSVQAASYDEGSPWKLTLGAGRVFSNSDVSEINRGLSQAGQDVQVSDFDDSRLGLSAWLAYQWSAHHSVELGYVDFGDIQGTISGDMVDPDELQAALNDNFPHSARGFALTWRPSYRVVNNMSVYGRVGPYFWKTKVNASNDLINTSHSSGVDVLLGAGVEWKVARRWAVGIGWDRGYFGSDNNDLISLSVSFH